LGKVFPKGLEPIQADPSGPPQDGVVLVGTSAEALKAGLKPGEVFVALNGFRVHTYEQYRVIRTLSKAPELNLVVWHGQYRHVVASPRERWLGVQVRSYNGPDDPDRKYL
jgi:membrane-associated protease RseP (regulator of RpoE activity)